MTALRKMSGDSIKAIPAVNGRRRIGGYIVRFTNQNDTDLHGQWFSKATDFGREFWSIVGKPVLVEHGLDPAFKSMPIGVFDLEREDDVGIYAEAWLYGKQEYEDMLRKRREQKRLDWTDETIQRKAGIVLKAVDTFLSMKPKWSSGALPQTVEVDEDTQHIDVWQPIEASTTHQAAEPDGTDAIAMRSVLDEVAPILSIQPDSPSHEGGGISPDGETARKDAGSADVEPAPVLEQSNEDTPAETTEEINKMDEQMLRDLIRVVLAEYGITAPGEPVPAAVNVPPEEELLASVRVDAPAELPKDEEEMAKSVAKVMDAARAYVTAWRGKKQKMLDAALANSKRHAPAIDDLPAGSSGNGFGHTPRNGIIEVNNRKFAHLSPMELGMAAKMAMAMAPRSAVPLAQRNVNEVMSEDLYKHATQALIKHHDAHPFSRVEEELAIKSFRPWKAGEIDASATTGAGLEWAAHEYDGQVWELARNDQIYQLMKSRGMIEKPVPDGFKTVIVPVEGADPTVYGGSEALDLDSAGNPETVYQITPYATANVTVTPGIFRTATAVTEILEEDSLVDNAAEANRKLNLALGEHIEKAMLNGDTVTTASTNINTIDGSPTASGLTKSYYLEFNGLLKSPLVTSTAYSRDAGGALSTSDYLNTMALLPAEQAARTKNLFFVVDFYTRNATLKLSDIKTIDVAGEKATLFVGNIPALWDVPLYMSGFMGKANTSGKVATVTPGNNTTGRILCVYAPYWAFSWKRQIVIEAQRFPQSETTAFYGSMRFCLTRRSASAAAVSYNVLV